jgi:hypothetical protein
MVEAARAEGLQTAERGSLFPSLKHVVHDTLSAATRTFVKDQLVIHGSPFINKYRLF